MKNQKLIIIIPIVVVALVIGTVLLYDLFRAKTFYDTGISDGEYIKIASQTIEAQKFLEKYPNATIYVDRSSRLAVDYRVDKYQINDTTQSWKGIRLRIFIDWRNNKPTSKFIDCSGTIIRKSLSEYLEMEKCLD